jgi:hypothetical protein
MKIASLNRVVALAAVLCCGCSLSEQSPAPDTPRPGGDTGALVLTFKLTSLSLQTLVPPISMQIVSFDVQGTGPDPLNDTFSDLGNTSGVLELSELSPGLWTISVDGRNTDGTIIGHGQTDPPVLVSSGQVTDAQITVAPLSGSGALDLVVNWTKKDHPGATVQCSLLSMSTGTVADLAKDFQLEPKGNPRQAMYNTTTIAAGYYLLTLRLYDAGAQFWGIAEAVRIVAGQTTSQSWSTPN